MDIQIIGSYKYQKAVDTLRNVFNDLHKNNDPEVSKIMKAKDVVIGRYQPIFDPRTINKLDKSDFLSFLQLKNNQHWSNLYRLQGKMTSDMEKLRAALAMLLDESKPIEQRLSKLVPNNCLIPGLGRATLTPILLVVFPEKYGVWNNTSKTAMVQLDIYPAGNKKEEFGIRYKKLNDVLLALSEDLQVDLWTLDALWWKILKQDSEFLTSEEVIPETLDERFGLEKYLREFINDNWEKIAEFKDWDIYEEEGEQVGVEYHVGEIGKIDILAKHKKDPRWLVIELKRNQTSDQTIGQLLRYMGWVKKEMAKGDEVKGMIICRDTDTAFKYALPMIDNIELLLYKVHFHLERSEDNNK